VLEPEAEGRDLIVSAQTGLGQTVAFGLAMAPQLLEEMACSLPFASRWRCDRSDAANSPCRSAAS
jgi:ATP-dependent RNA helicase DeaD